MPSSLFLLAKDHKRQNSIKINLILIFLEQDRYDEHTIRQFNYNTKKEYRNKLEVKNTLFRNHK